jgi:hypothetical protein
MTTRISILIPLLGLGLASACGGNDTSSGSDEVVGDSEADGQGSETDDASETDETDSDSETGEDPNAACASAWDLTAKKANGQTHAGYGVAIADNGEFAIVGKVENLDDDAWIAMFDPSGTALWEEVVDSGQGKDYAQSVIFDASGDIVLVGSRDNVNKELWVEKRSAATGALVWDTIFPSEFDGDNLPGDIALAHDGNIVVSATMRAGDQDSDVRVLKLSADQGAQDWTSSFSGAPDGNGFSIDRAGPLSVAADGSIYVGAEEGVDAMTKEGVLLKFGPDGGSAVWQLAPREDGSDHLQEVVAVVAGPENEAYFVVFQGAEPSSFWLYRVSPEGEVEWELDREAFQFAPTDGWVVTGLDIADEGHLTIGGRLTNEEVGQAITWSEAWIANIRLDGVGECLAHHTWKNTHIIPASTLAYGFAEGPEGVVVVGEIVDGPENYLWVGGFE